jgi:hypothetical protein
MSYPDLVGFVGSGSGIVSPDLIFLTQKSVLLLQLFLINDKIRCLHILRKSLERS